MAKTKKAKADVTAEPKAAPKSEPIPPAKVHELIGLQPPYDQPKPPPVWPGYLTVWDPGRSVLELRRKFRGMFYPVDWYEKANFASQTDLPQWRELRLTPVEPGTTYQEQFAKIPAGDEVAPARVVVTALAVHYLATGERIEVNVRCRDVLPSGRKVWVSFSRFGFSIGSLEDAYVSPSIGLAAVTSTALRRKK